MTQTVASTASAAECSQTAACTLLNKMMTTILNIVTLPFKPIAFFCTEVVIAALRAAASIAVFFGCDMYELADICLGLEDAVRRSKTK